jgi:hypothetical protein
MRWQCEHCNREFSKPYALTQHISQKHPFLQDSTNQAISFEQLDTSIWNLPEYSSSYNSSTEHVVNLLDIFLIWL